MTTPPDTLDLSIASLSHDGRGVARILQAPVPDTGMVVFVAGGLPGQTVRARVTRRREGYWEAQALTILRPAPDAVPPICPHHARCGGCPLQTMPYARQLQWKRQLALDALARLGGCPREAVETLLAAVSPSPALTRCRNKMEFAFGGAPGKGLRLGLRQRASQHVVEAQGCAMLPPEGLDMVEGMRRLAAQSGYPPYRPAAGRSGRHRVCTGFWRFLTLRRGLAADGRTPRWWALCLTSPGTTAQRATVRAAGEGLLAAFPLLAAFIHEERAAGDALPHGQKRVCVLGSSDGSGPAQLRLPLPGRRFRLDAASFFQVNTGASQTLARVALELMPRPDGAPAGLLDLYCGVGAPGLLLAPRYAGLWGLEQDARAVRLAECNAREAGAGACRYLAGDAAASLMALTASGTLPARLDALADPPRSGISPAALEALLRARPQNILYISCNPATLARDARKLQALYALTRLAAVDMFPHTPHVECVSLWQLRRSQPQAATKRPPRP